MNCDELRDYYELYTLGIAEDPELSEIRAHLERDCPICVPGVRGARELTTLIGATAPAVEAPARLRKRVLAIAGGRTAPRLDGGGGKGAPAHRGRRAAPAVDGVGGGGRRGGRRLDCGDCLQCPRASRVRGIGAGWRGTAAGAIGIGSPDARGRSE